MDGDLLALVQKLIDARGPATTAVSKVKGHADEGLVRGGRVRCLLWHGWFPALDCLGGRAGRPHTLAVNFLESRLGSCTQDGLNGWSASDEWVAGVRSGVPSPNHDVWTDGSLVRDDVTSVCCGGSGVFSFTSGSCWFCRSWGHWELVVLAVLLLMS